MRRLNLILRVRNIRVDGHLLQDSSGTYFGYCYGRVLGARIYPTYAELLMPPRHAVVPQHVFQNRDWHTIALPPCMFFVNKALLEHSPLICLPIV